MCVCVCVITFIFSCTFYKLHTYVVECVFVFGLSLPWSSEIITDVCVKFVNVTSGCGICSGTRMSTIGT